MVAQPKPLPVREVLCHHCNRPIEVPVGAMSANCRHCNRRVILEDLKIKAYHAVIKLETAGKVEILKKAQVVAELRVNELNVQGKVKGNVTCVGTVKVGKKADVDGNISCRSLIIESGATLDGHILIDPSFTPAAPVKPEDEDDDGLLRR